MMVYKMKTFSFFCARNQKLVLMDWFDFHFEIPVTDPTWIFLLVLLIILFAPIILDKLRIPHIVGMILAGVLVGEHGFNILVRDSSFELFGKVGLYYILFLAGLEMDMADFKKNRNKAVVLGLMAFIIPITIGLVTNTMILKYGIITSVLLASMYASGTMLAYPIVIRYGVSRHRSVSIAVGGTAVTDTLTLLVLAVVGGMFKGEMSGFSWIWLVLKVVLLGAFIVYLFPRIGRWFFRRYSDSVMQFIFVLAMVFLGAGLMEMVGMEGILGAFLAGLVLNRLIPHVSPLMNHLEFVGNALFIPYFLIGVGMLINVNVIFGHGAALKVALVMIASALTGKWIASQLTKKIFKMSTLEQRLMFGLSSAQAAATLAAVLVGYNILLPNGERLLNEDVLNGTVLLILVTCIVSSFTTERAARKIATCEASLEDDDTAMQEKILIPIANPETVEDLVSLSLLIRDPKQQDNLLALNVVNDTNGSDVSKARGKRYLKKAAKITAPVGITLQQITRYDVNIASGIVHMAKEYEVTDVIIGMHRKTNIVDSFFGMLAENLLKRLHREVMIAKLLMPLNTIRRINVAVPSKAEYETGFHKWVGHLCRMANTLGCKIHFFVNDSTLVLLQAWIEKKYKQTMADFSVWNDWDGLLSLADQMNRDHLLVIVSARRGSISYDAVFEKLPSQIAKNFANHNLIILYPDQVGDPQEVISFSNPRGESRGQNYDRVSKIFDKWLKKN